jgi:hypothetical protein
MNLLNLKPETRAPFSTTVKTLITEHKLAPDEIFMNVLESQENPDMNYWMTRVLVEEQHVVPEQEMGKDAAGEIVKPLQAACLLQNPGMVAALLELNAFQGSLTDREFQLTALIASKQEDQIILGIMMRYAQEMGHLVMFMKTLQNAPTQ